MRKWLIRFAAGCLCVAVADRLLWIAGTHALSNGLNRWEAQARAQGWTITEEGRQHSGFPLEARLTVNALAVEGGEQAVPGGVAWRAGRATLSVALLSPFTLSIVPEGEQHVRLSRLKAIVFTADEIRADVPLWPGADASASLSARAVTGGLAESHHPEDVQLNALELRVHARPGQGNAMSGELDIRAHGIGLPDIGHWPLGDTVEQASGKILISSPNLQGAHGAAGQAAAWRDGGGSVSAHDMALHWGPLVLQGNAQLGLDTNLQPAGKGTADVTGAAAALDALVDGKVIAPGLGVTGRAVLSVMPTAPGSDALRLPFGLHDNTLSVGPIPLARLSSIVW